MTLDSRPLFYPTTNDVPWATGLQSVGQRLADDRRFAGRGLQALFGAAEEVRLRQAPKLFLVPKGHPFDDTKMDDHG